MRYDEHPGIRWSVLRAGLTSPLALQHAMASSKAQTPAMALGTAVHSAVLEPDDFDTRYAVAPSFDRRTNAGKAAAAEWAAAHVGVEALDQDQHDACLRIRDRLHAHQDARLWLSESIGHREVEVYWTDADTGIECKAKPDALCPRLGLLWDLKTSGGRAGFDMDGIARSIASYFYHGQLGHYAAGLAQTGRMSVEAIGWIFVQSEAPFDVVVVQADDEMVQAGYALASKALRVYADALRADAWPGVAPRLQVVSLPAWAKNARALDALEVMR